MPSNDEFDDLRGIDLSELDLRHIELDIEKPPSKAWRWVALVALLGLGGLVLWFPSTSYYQLSGQSSWIFFGICLVATVVGISGGRWLWAWVQETAARYTAPRDPRLDEPPKPASTLRRWVTLLIVIAGIITILVWLPASGRLRGSGSFSGVWFLAAIGAIAVGVTLGRWLLMQGEASKDRPKAAPIRLPPWFKWVTLSVLILAGAIALLAPTMFSGAESESVRFALGGVGFAVGIVAAIWIARRFDESEAKAQERARQRRPGADASK